MDSNKKSSFQRFESPMGEGMNESLPGTKTSIRGLQTVVPTGIPSLDVCIGGGLSLTSLTLLEMDEHRQYSTMLMKAFISEAIYNKHIIIISSPHVTSFGSRIFKELPTATQVKPDFPTPSTQQSGLASGDEMKIAWRYQSIGNWNNSSPTLQFDFGNYLPDNFISERNIHLTSHEKCLELIKTVSTSSPSNTVIRVMIDDISSPLSSLPLETIPQFIFQVKSLIRTNSNAVCLISLSSQIILSSPRPYVLSRSRNMSDCVIELVSFDETSNTPYKEYCGLVNMIKLPKLNSLSYYCQHETLDLGLQIRRKKHCRFLVVEKLCLPPDLSETVSRSQASTSTCGSANVKMDF